MKKRPPQYILDLPIEVRAEMALQRAAKKVAAENKRLGMPLIVGENGKVVKIPPEQLPDYSKKELNDYPEVFDSAFVGRINLKALADAAARKNGLQP